LETQLILVPQEKIAAFTESGWWGALTLDDYFRANTARFNHRVAVVDAPNREAFTDGAPRSLSWLDLEKEVTQLCRVLVQDGLTKDDIIIMQLPNCIEQFVVYMSCARLGVIVTPLPIQYRKHELKHVLSRTSAKAVITCRRIGNHAHAAMFSALGAELPHQLSVYAFSMPGGVLPEGAQALDLRMSLAVDGSQLDDYLSHSQVSANDVFSICWTSGTEAMPKGVPRSHNEWLVLGPTAIESANLSQGSRMLCPFPLVNMAGISVGLCAWLMLGGTVVQHQPFNLEVFLGQLREERIDYTIAAPAILAQLLHKEDLVKGIDFVKLNTIGSGSAPLSPWLVAGFKDRFGVDIVNHFGSNEGASLTTSPKDVPDPSNRARYFPRPGAQGIKWHVSTTRKVSTRLVDLDTGMDITSPGQVGELRYAGATIFSGYFNDPELTSNAFDDKGFYKTGDLFELGGENNEFYRYAGRSKDVVIRGGMNISSEEVENLILAHPQVSEIAVVGYPDEAMGERLCACIVPHLGEKLTLEELKKFLLNHQQVAFYKIPERLLLMEKLPRNPVGKILKRILREQVQTYVQ
jgi:acyl-CoA synthetase (AMP-forming)/AMP-acid ligase II